MEQRKVDGEGFLVTIAVVGVGSEPDRGRSDQDTEEEERLESDVVQVCDEMVVRVGRFGKQRSPDHDYCCREDEEEPGKAEDLRPFEHRLAVPFGGKFAVDELLVQQGDQHEHRKENYEYVACAQLESDIG